MAWRIGLPPGGGSSVPSSEALQSLLRVTNWSTRSSRYLSGLQHKPMRCHHAPKFNLRRNLQPEYYFSYFELFLDPFPLLLASLPSLPCPGAFADSFLSFPDVSPSLPDPFPACGVSFPPSPDSHFRDVRMDVRSSPDVTLPPPAHRLSELRKPSFGTEQKIRQGEAAHGVQTTPACPQRSEGDGRKLAFSGLGFRL